MPVSPGGMATARAQAGTVELTCGMLQVARTNISLHAHVALVLLQGEK